MAVAVERDGDRRVPGIRRGDLDVDAARDPGRDRRVPALMEPPNRRRPRARSPDGPTRSKAAGRALYDYLDFSELRKVELAAAVPSGVTPAIVMKLIGAGSECPSD